MQTDENPIVLDERALRSGQASFHLLPSGRLVIVVPMRQRGTGRITKIMVRSTKGSADSE